MKPILVTGGAKGLGAEICYQLADQRHDIVVHYRSSERAADSVVASCKQRGVLADKIEGDFSGPLDTFITTYLTRFPQTKGIVHNVGNYLVAPPSQTEEGAWKELFQTNFFAPVALTQALLPALKRAKGAIVTIGTSGLNGALVNAAAYCATKAALLFYTRSLAKELASEGVTVNMVSPGFLENSVDFIPNLPMGRPAFLSEAASVVAFFFDEKNRYVTGQNIEVSGGFGL